MANRRIGCFGTFSLFVLFFISVFVVLDRLDFIADVQGQWFTYLDDILAWITLVSVVLLLLFFFDDVSLRRALKITVASVLTAFALALFGFYALSPLDIIPDAILVLGWLDDLVIGLVLFFSLILKPWMWALASDHKTEKEASDSLLDILKLRWPRGKKSLPDSEDENDWNRFE